jgi:hypothetical protein
LKVGQKSLRTRWLFRMGVHRLSQDEALLAEAGRCQKLIGHTICVLWCTVKDKHSRSESTHGNDRTGTERRTGTGRNYEEDNFFHALFPIDMIGWLDRPIPWHPSRWFRSGSWKTWDRSSDSASCRDAACSRQMLLNDPISLRDILITWERVDATKIWCLSFFHFPSTRRVD